jgi:filamentous hemagglutinin family protein
MRFKFIALGLVISVQVVAEGIATDGTMGAAQTLSGSSITIPQTLGSTVGNNLFHSFSDFNINTGQTVTFTGSDNLQNVISRVTGDNKSVIDGMLKSDIKNADFYFINPNGITFNVNASVDVPAAFHVTTADKMDFGKNGGVFYADLSKKSQLSSDSPVALGFLGTSKVSNGLLKFDNAKLEFKEGKTVDMVVGQISFENGTIITEPAGEIRLVATQNEGVESLEKAVDGTLSLSGVIPSSKNGGIISLKNSVIDMTGNGGGRFLLWGGDTSFENNSKAILNNSGETNSVSTKGIYANVNSLNIDSSLVASDSLAEGKAGNIAVKTLDYLTIFGNSKISSFVNAKGDAGNINVIVGNNLVIDGKWNKSSGIISENNFTSSGQTGNVSVEANGDIKILGGGMISTITYNDEKAGDVTINGNNKLIINSEGYSQWLTGVGSGTLGKGNSGNVLVVSKDDMGIVNGGIVANSTFGLGNAGTTTVLSGGRLTIDNQDSQVVLVATGINSTSMLGGTGNAGTIKVVSNGDINIVHGAVISSTTFTNGKAGDIAVISNGKLIINPQDYLSENCFANNCYTGIIAGCAGNGSCGDLSVEVKGDTIITRGGVISNSTVSSGNAGTLTVLSEGNVVIDNEGNQGKWGRTGIFSTAEPTSSGSAGVVSVISKGNISLLGEGGEISSSTLYNTGDSNSKAGAVTVNADTLYINQGSISSEVLDVKSGGEAGNVTVKANDWLQLTKGGNISIENNAIVQADLNVTNLGKIAVTAPNINMTKNSHITSNSTGNVAAGNIDVNFTNRLNMNASFITTEANDGDGGSIKINGDKLIYLKNSGFKTTVSGEDSNGGDISVKAPALVMDTGLIQANAVSGNGGNINLALQALIPSANQLIKSGTSVDWDKSPSNVIQAASQSGVSGTVTSSAPQLNLSGVLANIGNNNFDNRLVSQDYCAVNKGSSLSKKGKGGLPLRAKDLQVY